MSKIATAKNAVVTTPDPHAAYNRMKAEAHKAYAASIAAMKKSGMTSADAKAAIKLETYKRRDAEALQRAVREHVAGQRLHAYASLGDILAAKRG